MQFFTLRLTIGSSNCLCSLAIRATDSADVTYTGYDNNHRWSDAVDKCKQRGGFLAKIKNLDELIKAREAKIEHKSIDFWVGIKYDESKKDFVWADGTFVTSTANFEAIVNRNEQQIQGYSRRCMYLSTQDTLLPDDCEVHRKYLCQVGETDDATSASK